MKTSVTKIVFATACLFAFAGATYAQDQIKLKVAHFVPATHPGVVYGTDVFMKAAKAATDSKVQFEFYPAQQAGKAKEFLDLLKTGVVDIAEIGTGYFSSDKMPLLGVIEMPGLVKSVCDGTRAVRAVGEPGGPLYEGDFKPFGVRVLSFYVYPPYGPSASLKPINSVEDLKGLKLRNAGGVMGLSTVTVGAVPVGITSAEVFEALERGTLDSMMSSYLTVKDYELNKAAKYGVTGYSLGTPGIFAMISERKFQALPQDVQDALAEAGKKAEESFCAYADSTEASTIEDLQKNGGMEIHSWSDEDKAKLDEMLTNIPKEWVKTLDGRGKPASATLKGFRAALPQ